jgi:hypothetical protein
MHADADFRLATQKAERKLYWCAVYTTDVGTNLFLYAENCVKVF